MHRLRELPPSVQAYLGDFVKRWRQVVVLRAAGAALAVLAVWVLVAATADRLLHLPGTVRLASLVVAALTALAVGMARLRRIRGPVNWITMAGLIEEYDPRFDQALITVTSRVLGSPEHRGSDEILSHLLRDVERRAADTSQRKMLALRTAARPWMVLLVVVGVIAGLSCIPDLGGGRLLARLIAPLVDLPPVTTTELDVNPKGAEIMQSDQFRIDVRTRRLGSSPLLIFINDEGDNWTQYPMDDGGGGRFSYTIKTVGHDFRYKLRGGDAETPPFAVRVKRPPAVAEFRIRYTYPPYAGKAPFTVVNTTGTIEAPAGSDVLLTIVATEPLQWAELRAGEKILPMEKTAEANVRQTSLHFERDTPYETLYEIDLISTREVRGTGPSRMVLRATADRPPAVRLQEGGRVLGLNPRDILPLSYQVMDDYGVVSMNLFVQINGDRALQFPLRLNAARRRVEDTINFDLASLDLKVGDVLTLTLGARDTAEKEAFSESLRVLVSPFSVDLDAHERINGLTAASNFAASLVEETAQAARAVDESSLQGDHRSAVSLAADASASRRLTSASEAATLLKQTLLRVEAHSHSPELSVAVAEWLDVAQQQAQTADDLFVRAGSSAGMGAGARKRLRAANAQARVLLSQVQAVAQGERALAVIFEQLNLKAVQGTAAPADAKAAGSLMPVVDLAGDEIKRNAAELGLTIGSPEMSDKLGARVDAARDVLRVKQPIDFVALLRERSRDLQRDPDQNAGMQLRLATAAQAEAVRRDGDMVRAHDLELAARAAGAFEAAGNPPPPGKQGTASGLNALATAIVALQREQALGHHPLTGRPAEEARTVRQAAARARDEMSRWAGETNQPKIASAPPRAGELETMALRANAASSRREYKNAAEEDRKLMLRLTDAARKPGGRSIEGDASPAATQVVEDRQQRVGQASEAIGHQMTAAETIEKLVAAQERYLQEGRAAKVAARDLSARQHLLVDQIAAVEHEQRDAAFPTTAAAPESGSGNLRVRALTAVLAAQEELTAAKQQLATAQEADGARRKAAERAGAARHEVATAVPQRLRHANRAADQADQDARDAADDFERAIVPLLPQTASDLADGLEPFALETSDARDEMSGPLLAALTEFSDACNGGDAAAVSRAAVGVRNAIDAAQKDLSAARDKIAEPDPLMAARLFARAASESLARHPPDLHWAVAHQASAAQALAQAWERTIHRAAEIRLSEVPSLQSVYGPAPPARRDTSAASTLSPSMGAHDWPRLHAKGDDLSATAGDPDPPGYEEQIRLYFQVMGKSQEKK